VPDNSADAARAFNLESTPYFQTVKRPGEQGNIRVSSNFFEAAWSGTLPLVLVIIPILNNSDHQNSGRNSRDGSSWTRWGLFGSIEQSYAEEGTHGSV
jgi:hypothetical protein